MITFKFIPHSDVENMSAEKRLNKLLGHVKENEIVLLEGRLPPEEETQLIAKTMEAIDEEFKGIEISVLHRADLDGSFFDQLRNKVVSLLLGNKYGFTLIGSASVIKEIQQDPGRIQFLAQDIKES
jgi:hypothetical protein